MDVEHPDANMHADQAQQDCGVDCWTQLLYDTASRTIAISISQCKVVTQACSATHKHDSVHWLKAGMHCIQAVYT